MLLLRRMPWLRPIGVFLLTGLFYLTYINLNQSDWLSLNDESLRDILNSTLGFQKIFVINLPSRTDRRDAITLAAATHNLDIEFIDGVTGGSIVEKAFPPGKSRLLNEGIKGSWRSHMNAIQTVVARNLTSALIFEDDVDWDVRLYEQLQLFARASRFLTGKTQGVPSYYSTKGVGNAETDELSIHNQTNNPIIDILQTIPLANIRNKYQTRLGDKVLGSPYGDPSTWDVLWLGHCGVGFPRSLPRSGMTTSDIENLVLDLPNDPTVPLPKYLKAHPFGPLDPLSHSHPPHTRVYHRASGGALCTIGYAVSQRGARRLLHEFSIRKWERIFDAALGEWCAGSDVDDSKPNKNSSPTAQKQQSLVEDSETTQHSKNLGDRVCITTQPPIFAHYHPPAGQSDIGGLGGGYVTTVETKYIRFSVRMNLEKLSRGDKEGLEDQWPDN